MLMNFGVCNLSIVPVRSEPNDKSEMVSQLLYGEHFTITEQLKQWTKICAAFDNYEGWISNKQFISITKKEYETLHSGLPEYAGDLVAYISDHQNRLMSIPLGANINSCSLFSHIFEGGKRTGKGNRKALVETALLYLNSPYLWGGKTPFGIDCSGFTQMVYKINGYALLRDANLQATQGKVLSFIEETTAGDLAFFDNDDGVIIHVGIILEDNYIIHASGKVRIDRIDHTGIFNVDTKKYSHQLRVIKKVI